MEREQSEAGNKNTRPLMGTGGTTILPCCPWTLKGGRLYIDHLMTLRLCSQQSTEGPPDWTNKKFLWKGNRVKKWSREQKRKELGEQKVEEGEAENGRRWRRNQEVQKSRAWSRKLKSVKQKWSKILGAEEGSAESGRGQSAEKEEDSGAGRRTCNRVKRGGERRRGAGSGIGREAWCIIGEKPQWSHPMKYLET